MKKTLASLSTRGGGDAQQSRLCYRSGLMRETSKFQHQLRNPLVARLTKARRPPSALATLLIAALMLQMSLAFIVIIVVGDTWGVWFIRENDMYNLAGVVAIVGWVALALVPPLTAAIGAGMIVQETQQDQHELLRLTGLSEPQLRLGYTLGALYRMRVLLVATLVSVPALAVATQWTCCVYYDLLNLDFEYDIANTLNVTLLALGFWGVNLAGAAVAVRLTLWRRVKVMALAPSFVLANLCCVLTLGLGGGAFFHELFYYGTVYLWFEIALPREPVVSLFAAQLIRLAIMGFFACVPYLITILLVNGRNLPRRPIPGKQP